MSAVVTVEFAAANILIKALFLKGEVALITQNKRQDHALLCLFLQWASGLSWFFLSTLLLLRFSLSR